MSISRALPAALAAALVLTMTATAQMTGMVVRDVSAEVDTPPGLTTWRYSALFEMETAPVYSVTSYGEDYKIVFATNDPEGIRNDGGPDAGTIWEDFPQRTSAPWDTWLTIAETPDSPILTLYSPGFLDNNGVDAVLYDGRTSFLEDDWGEEWWAIPQPSSREVIVAQFTVGAGYGVHLSGGVVVWIKGLFADPTEAGDPEGGGEGDSATTWERFCASTYGLDPGCTCRPDLDEDGAILMSDLVTLMSRWGPCSGTDCCRADLNGNGTVDYQDLLTVLSTWGDCPSPGACCLPDGTCAEMDCIGGAECVAAGGLYLGDDTTCEGHVCP